MIIAHLDLKESILLKSNDRSFHALYFIIQQLDPERQLWYADKINKTAICVELNITMAALEKMLFSLKDRKLIEKSKRGIYQLSSTLMESY